MNRGKHEYKRAEYESGVGGYFAPPSADYRWSVAVAAISCKQWGTTWRARAYTGGLDAEIFCFSTRSRGSICYWLLLRCHKF